MWKNTAAAILCFLYSVFPLSIVLSLHTLNDFGKRLWSSKAWFFMNLSFQKLCQELYTALPHSWIALVIKNLSKLNTIWLELIARVLNMLIGLKGNKYYSKVFKRVNYKLSNNIFWVVISGSPTTINLLSCSELNLLIKMVIFPYDLCISTFWNDFFLVLHDVWIFSLILLHFCYCLMFGFILPFGIVWKFKI